MQKILAILLGLSMLAIVTPVQAAESVSAPYNGAIGWRVPVTGTGTPADWAEYLALVICPAGCDFNDPEECIDANTCVEVPTGGAIPVINPVGGSRLRVEGIYTNVIVTANDDVYGSGAGISTCFWNPDGDNTCNPQEDYPSAPGCGPAALLGSPFAANFVTVWIFTVIVEDDLSVCGGSAGTMNADFF